MVTGEEIKAARKRAGLSQAQLAELVDVSQRTIGGWERGENAPGIAEPRLMAVLRDHLVTDDGAPRLRDVADVELLAEIARRFARNSEQRKEGDDGGNTAATKSPGSGPDNVSPLRTREDMQQLQTKAARHDDED